MPNGPGIHSSVSFIGTNNGPTKPEIASLITHLASYAGWPNAMSAAPVVRKVFEERGG
nr:carboxymuconolactone decarboxylase family protein [Rhizobium sp. BK602]